MVDSLPGPLILICGLLVGFTFCLLLKLICGNCLNDDATPRQQKQRQAGHAASLTRVVVQNQYNLNSFKYEGANDNECAICLSVFEEGGKVKQIPNCKHFFHAHCIDTWLGEHGDCPLCRSVVATTTVVQPQK